MSTNHRDLEPRLRERIQELVEDIYETERTIAEVIRETNFEANRKELKELLKELPTNEKGHHVIIVGRLATKVFVRKGRLVHNIKKAKELLHSSTFRAIFQRSAPSWVLDSVKEIR